jgi:hypothetical protein
MPMRFDFIVLGLLFVLVALGIRLKAKFLSERIGAVGFLLMGITIIVVGLIL